MTSPGIPMRSPVLAAALALGLAPWAALAADPPLGDGTAVRADDRLRLDALDQATGAALRRVLAAGRPADSAAIGRLLAGDALPGAGVDLAALAGDWRCSMAKLGGAAGLVTYPPFRCRIAADGTAVAFDKLTGSQRTRGRLHHDGDRIVYLGSTFVEGGRPLAYADFPDALDTAVTETLPDVALLEVTGRNAARLLFPMPYRESVLNILTLSR